MDMERFYGEIGEIYMKLSQETPEFIYNENTGEFYSTEDIEIDGFLYTVVVREDGLVTYGEVRGEDFHREGILGFVHL